MIQKRDFKISVRKDLKYFFLFLLFHQSCLSLLSSANAFKLKPQLSFKKTTTNYDGRPFKISQQTHERDDDIKSRNGKLKNIKSRKHKQHNPCTRFT